MKRLREWFEGLGERERRLVVIFGAVIAAFVLLLVPYLSSMALDSRREEIKELRAAIAAVQGSRDKVADRHVKRDAIAARYANKAPPLAGFIESAAKAANIAIPESQDLSEVPHGKRFVERSTQVRLRKVGMLSLVRMLEKIEGSGYPVVVSKLHIRRRGGETDSYDVELNVSSFDQTAAAAGKEPKGDAKGDAGKLDTKADAKAEAKPEPKAAESARPASSGDAR
ncbi:MAG: type II secretion system protein M [Deltaproteobacteria bacterium]|nr:type II secretion system protein M [Deltaproteobacteria bacterium]